MKKILYFVGEDSSFCSHRLPLALAAKEKGVDVVVVTRVTKHGDLIKNSGFKLIPLRNLHRSKFNLWNEFLVLKQLISIFYKEKPCVIHNIAMKPVLYGSIAAFLTRAPKVVNTISGLGFLFTNNENKTLIKRKIFMNLFKLLSKRKQMHLILQNKDDFDIFKDLNLIDSDRLFLIRGSGVDIKTFEATPEPDASQGIRIAFVARMLKDKGILELIEAIRLLRKRNVNSHFIFCGDIDAQNPTSVNHDDLNRWHEEGLIEWRGHCTHIPDLYKDVHISVLPSYREGLPKSLLEAASSARPIVSTDVPGCREIVGQGLNGLLVPSKNSRMLAEALEVLINDSNLRQSMGNAGRDIVEKNFSDQIIIEETMACYQI